MDTDKNRYENFIRWISGALSKEEEKQLEKDLEHTRNKLILDEVDQWTVPALNKEKGYSELKKSLTDTPGAKVVPLYKTAYFKMAAAFLILAIGAIYFLASEFSEVTHQTAVAEFKEITLPDGSIVEMEPSTTLSYNKNDWDRKRRLKIKGAAYFNVTNGAPFEVDFELGKVVVLGTSFEIKKFKDFASIACLKGSIDVLSASLTEKLLPGEGVQVTEAGKIERFEFDNAPRKRKINRFHSAPLYVVIESLEAQYDITIKSDDVYSREKFTGVFVKNDLDLALKMVFEPMKISYKREGKSVILEKL